MDSLELTPATALELDRLAADWGTDRLGVLARLLSWRTDLPEPSAAPGIAPGSREYEIDAAATASFLVWATSGREALRRVDEDIHSILPDGYTVADGVMLTAITINLPGEITYSADGHDDADGGPSQDRGSNA